MKSNPLTRTEKRQAKKKKEVIDVTIQLIRQHGYDGTTMEQIAEVADIAKGTLYNYFPVKEAIIDAFIQAKFAEKNVGRMKRIQQLPDTRSRMIYIFNDLITGIQIQKEIFEKYLIYRVQSILSLHAKDADERGGLYLLIVEIIRLGQEQDEIRQDIPRLIIEDLFEFILISITKQMYLASGAFEAQTIIEQCVDLFMSGVMTTSGKDE